MDTLRPQAESVCFEVEDLHKAFGAQRVLDGVSLKVQTGESVAIIGQSGSGKSVLLKHLIRLLVPDRGRVLYRGRDLADMSSGELVEVRRKIGMLFQSAALFDSMTVAENVGLELREARRHEQREIDRIVAEKLEMVGLAEAGDKYPAELSGGMRKRVGLARAIANDPDVLLYDEPTTGLDPVTADVINDLIVNLNRQLRVTSVVVTHDMKSAFRIAGRVVMLYDARVRFDGSPQELQRAGDPVLRQFIAGDSAGPIRI
ncbi:MAG TPA: ABC transporter ATP-binding protein [candidate division Zixibacteria bacterium]|nr:ABC transporter ATP-binding protein [candidate division Zixibacteria bacterium]